MSKAMSILDNAIDSIVIGLEDYESKDERRLLSSARNIFAGVILLFKHKLCELSPPGTDEVLIKQKIIPETDKTSGIKWKGKGEKTVDVHEIKSHFNSLGIKVDWKRFEEIREYRNNIEHYYSSKSPQSAQRLISDSFILIRDFVADYLNEDPRELLGYEAWSVLIKVSEVYEKEKQECHYALEALHFHSNKVLEALKGHSCEECGSGLIIPRNRNNSVVDCNFECKSCGTVTPYAIMIRIAISECYMSEVNASYADGNNAPLADCSQCGGVYLYNEGVCSYCGYAAKHECWRCGSEIMPEELYSEPLCGYCDHFNSKDD